MNLREQAVRGVFWSAAGNWGYQLTTLVVFAILSRLLTPDDFGLVALAAVFTALMKLLSEQGLADALVQRPDLEPEHLDTSFWLNLAVGLVLAAGLVAAAPLIAELVNEPDVAPVLAWLAPVLVLAAVSSVQRAILTRELRFASLTVRTLSSVVAGGVVGVSAAYAGAGVWSLVAQALTIEAVSAVALWTASDWRPRLRFSRAHVWDLLSFGSNIVAYRLLRFFNTRVDNLIVGSVLGATALGFYVVAYRILQLLINVTTAIVGSVAFPVFSRIQEDQARVQSAYYRTIRLTGVLAFPAFLGVVAVAPEATRLLFGEQWDASVPAMRVLAVAGLVNSILFVNSIVMKALGKPSWRVAIMAVTAAALVAAFALVVNRGILAVATAFAAVSAGLAPLWLIGVHKLIGLEGGRYLRQVGPPFLASAAMVVVVLGLKAPLGDLALVWRVVLLVGAGFVSYATVLWLVARPVAREALELARQALPTRAGPRS